MTTSPFAFAKKVDDALRQLDRIPLYGKAPRIDLDRLASLLASKLQISQLSLTAADAFWRAPSELRKDLGADALTLKITLFPLKGDVFWVISKEDLAQLSSSLLGKQRTDLPSELLQEGFYLYAVLQTLNLLQEEEPFREFTLRLSEELSEHEENSYCLDLKISLFNSSCFGRLILSATFLSSWQNHFASLREIFSLSPLAKTLEVPVGIRIGSVLLSQSEWAAIEKGDLLLLDRGSYNPRQKEGVASLTLGATPLFHVSVKENKIKLLEPALFYEEGMDLDKPEATPEVPSQEEARSIPIKDLPLSITVELARMRMTVDQLMGLSPGNFLELPVHPEQTVILSVNGQQIARGELVHLGEALGVRILETS